MTSLHRSPNSEGMVEAGLTNQLKEAEGEDGTFPTLQGPSQSSFSPGTGGELQLTLGATEQSPHLIRGNCAKMLVWGN